MLATMKTSFSKTISRCATLCVITFCLALTVGLLPAQAANKGATKPDAKPLTQGLNHVGLSVRDLKSSRDFFVDTLGWRLAGGYPDYPSSFVTDGQVFVTLWQVADPKTAVGFNRKNDVGLHHLALTVESFEALDQLHQRLLKTEGVVIEFAPELNGDGPTKHMMVYEPGGNRIEFAHRPSQ